MSKIEKLKDAYKALEEEKARLKAMRGQVKEEQKQNHKYCELSDQIKELRDSRKLIDDDIIDALRLRDDITESTLEIAAQKGLIAGLTIELIQEGGFDPFGDIKIDDLIITPSVTVKYTKQLSMNF